MMMLSQLSNKPVVVEGRNFYDPEVVVAEGFTYYSVGCKDFDFYGVRTELSKDGKIA